MIKNGHHHYQMNAAAGKDAGTTPGAAACSPEKRRRRIRVWCDGWWESYRMTVYVMKMLQLHAFVVSVEHVWMNVTSLSPIAGAGLLQDTGRSQDCYWLLQGYQYQLTFRWIFCYIYIYIYILSSDKYMTSYMLNSRLHYFWFNPTSPFSYSIDTLLHNITRTDVYWYLLLQTCHVEPIAMTSL